MFTVGGLFYHSSVPLSAESLIVVRGQQTFSKKFWVSTCWRGRISCLASGHDLHRLIIHASALSLSKFRMLTRWNCARSSGRGLHNMPPISQIAPAFCAASSCRSSEVHLCCSLHCQQIRASGVLHMLATVCLYPICQHNLGNLSVLSGSESSLSWSVIQHPCLFSFALCLFQTSHWIISLTNMSSERSVSLSSLYISAGRLSTSVAFSWY